MAPPGVIDGPSGKEDPMNGDDATNSDPDAVTVGLDPDALKDAHGRTGRMLKTAGLPFEDDEFDDELVGEADDDSTSSSSEGEDSSSD
jgi:hypothetical protein